MARNEAEIIARMRQALGERKRAILPTAWRVGNRVGKLIVPMACQCGVVGVQLHVTAWETRPDEDVSFMLCLDEPEETWPIARIDWRPVHPHVNALPGPLKGLLTDGTGLHALEDNVLYGLNTMKTKNLPVCRPVVPNPPDWPTALTYVRDTLIIDNIEGLPSPPWSPTLL